MLLVLIILLALTAVLSLSLFIFLIAKQVKSLKEQTVENTKKYKNPPNAERDGGLELVISDLSEL